MIGDGPDTHEPGSDRRDFENLLRPILPLAFRYAARLSGDRDLAMDLVQESSVSAFGSFHLYVQGTNFKAWFLRILLHHFYRTKQIDTRRASVALSEAPESYLYLQARKIGLPMSGDPVAVMLGKIDSQTVYDALLRLPQEYREAATLHFVTEMSYAECAETLQIPVGTVRSRLHRARRMLQVSLWQIAEERGYVPAQRSL